MEASIQKIQKEANEFRFYASDKINILLDRLDTFYNAYIRLLLNQDFRLLQDAFDFILKGDFTGLLSFMQNPDSNIEQQNYNNEIYNLHSEIKKQLRKELELEK